ncbi:SWEET3 [Symbiodinium sp. CCMP2456]|nr:SWEET3 [Symbiodinium sp. CCMP2456]
MFADLILESLATCLAFFFMTSPLTQAIEVIRTPAKVKHINPVNLLGFFLNCMTQLGYGIFMPIPPLIRCNAYGAAVGLFSIATCWYFALETANAKRWNTQACVGTISVCALSGLIFAYAGLGGEGAAARVGSLGILVSIIMYAAPLSVLREVLQTKSSKTLPGPQIFMGFLNSLCWFAVGLRRQKIPVWVPNVIGMLLSLLQLALILKFPDRPENVEEQRKEDAPLLPVALVNGARNFQDDISSGKWQGSRPERYSLGHQGECRRVRGEVVCTALRPVRSVKRCRGVTYRLGLFLLCRLCLFSVSLQTVKQVQVRFL